MQTCITVVWLLIRWSYRLVFFNLPILTWLHCGVITVVITIIITSLADICAILHALIQPVTILHVWKYITQDGYILEHDIVNSNTVTFMAKWMVQYTCNYMCSWVYIAVYECVSVVISVKHTYIRQCGCIPVFGGDYLYLPSRLAPDRVSYTIVVCDYSPRLDVCFT